MNTNLYIIYDILLENHLISAFQYNFDHRNLFSYLGTSLSLLLPSSNLSLGYGVLAKAYPISHFTSDLLLHLLISAPYVL